MKRLLALAVLSLGFSLSSQATVITTLASEDSTISSWGLPDTAAYGQTFNLASAADLNSVLFRIDDNGVVINYDLHIFSWSGNIATGASLASASGSTTGVSGMSSISSSVGSLALAAGDYVAFFQATSNGAAMWGSNGSSDVYAGGEFVFQNNSGDTSEWTTSAWNTDWEGTDFDTAFELVFDRDSNPIPAPATIALFALGLGALGLRRRQV